MSEIILRTDGLTKVYRGVPAVDNVSVTIEKGDIYGFVGKNGAGKTTFMRIISGLIAPTSGSYRLLGADSNNPHAILAARGKICSIIEAPALYMNMTALDNMKQQCLINGKAFDRINGLLDMVELSGSDRKQAKFFSLGMKQRLGIAMAMVAEPEFMLLDEPTNGLDPDGILKIRNLLFRLKEERGVTIMVSSHILSELKMLATRFGFIHNGRLIDEVTAAELERKARPATELFVSDTGIALLALKEIGLDCAIGQGRVLVYGNYDLAAVAVRLRECGVTLNNIISGSYDLEKYFVDLIGGVRGGSPGRIDPFAGGSV